MRFLSFLLLLGILLQCQAACNNNPPPGSPQYSCEQQKVWGKCGESWMRGYCETTCGTCTPVASSTCNDNPPGGGYTCKQQKSWGKCNESWMQGFCQVTCGVCVPSNNNPANGGTVTSAPTSSGPILPGRLAVKDKDLVISGRRVFLNGANMAWQNYGSDFGAGSPGSAYFPSQLRDALVAIRQAGGNSIRIWLHCSGDVSPQWGGDGRVTGIPGDLIPSMRAYLRVAKEQNILVVFVLWNFMITQRHANFYTDDSIVQSYIDNALIPMVTALKDEPALAAWEISNEPEGTASEYGWETNKVPIARIQRAINWQAHAIHTIDKNLLVTIGSWAADANTDAVWGFQNRYTNARLIAAGGRSLGYLDFYQLHYYRWMGRHTSRSLIDNPASFYKLDKPLVLGEFSQSGTDGMTIEQMYHHAYDTGYAGAWAWQVNGGGQDADQFSTILRGIASLSSSRPQGLEVDLNGQLPQSFLANNKPAVFAVVPDISGTGPDMGVVGPPLHDDSTSSSLNVALIAGLAAGGAAVVGLVIVISLVMYQRKQRARVETATSHITVV